MSSYLKNTNLVNDLKVFETYLKSQNQYVYGIYKIKIIDWDVDDYSAMVAVSKSSLVFSIAGKVSTVNFNSLDQINMDDHSISVNQKGDTQIKFNLIEGDNEATKSLVKNIEGLKNRKDIDEKNFEQLPDMRDNGFLDQSSLYLFTTALIMIIIGFSIQRASYVWAWFLIVAAIFVIFIGVVVTIVKKKLI